MSQVMRAGRGSDWVSQSLPRRNKSSFSGVTKHVLPNFDGSIVSTDEQQWESLCLVQ